MNDFIELNKIQETDYLFTVFSFFICIICSYALKKTYEVSSSSLTDKSQIANIIPLLSATTFLVILVVKSSLALSLGLVGALSIVRFRTPIKEPEELVYLFISIAIGLGFGSGQITITATIFILILFLIFIFYKSFNKLHNNDFNLIIEIDQSQNLKISGILENLKKVLDNYDLIKYELKDDELVIMLKINLVNLEKIDNTKKNILDNYPNAKISFYEAKQLY